MFLFINITFSYTIPDVISLSSRKFFAGCFLGGLQRIQFPRVRAISSLIKTLSKPTIFQWDVCKLFINRPVLWFRFLFIHFAPLSNHFALYFYTLHGRILITKFNPTAITYIVCWCLTIISPWCFWLFSTTYSTNIKFIIFVH